MEVTFTNLCRTHEGTASLTYWLLSLLQLVYPHDFRLTEKEVVTMFSPLVLKILHSTDGGFLLCVLFVAENQYLLLVLPRLLLR